MSKKEKGEKRKRRLGLVKSSVGFPQPGPHHTCLYMRPHGRAIFPMSTSLGGVGLLLVFPEISRVIVRVWESKVEDRQIQREESMCVKWTVAAGHDTDNI